MSLPLVECVPNFSEARRPEIVDAIANAITSSGNVSILDRHSDLDHNRTVITFVGSPQAVEEAAFNAIATAGELIDLEEHTGEHPRIGATDVVPFIPISGIDMQDCVKIAQRLGKRVGQELGIPVYLYEAAATRPEQKNLENIRRGQYEALKHEIASDPDRRPDFGPASLGSAGATVIGARQFLIAFNVYLTTDDVTIADKIARAVRHSSGGLRYVKALGLLVDGRAQVSMNLTNFQQTPIARVVEMIRREAARYGVAIHHSELVGLIPQEALIDASTWQLQLDQFDPDQVLENRLYASLQASNKDNDQSPEALQADVNFLNALASSSPTPGGGAASAYAAAMAASLVGMVARLTIGNKKYAQFEEQMRAVEQQAEGLRAYFTNAVSEDSAAFEAVIEAYRLPKNSSQEKEQRRDQIQTTTLKAAQVPLEVAQKSVEVLELTQTVANHGNLNAISDAGSAAALAWAAISGAVLNVRINALSLQDKTISTQLTDEIGDLQERAKGLHELILLQIHQRGGFS
jgi:glutamate formiminotransferase/formiminotetrahydrofolate cyclodeaminase